MAQVLSFKHPLTQQRFSSCQQKVSPTKIRGKELQAGNINTFPPLLITCQYRGTIISQENREVTHTFLFPLSFFSGGVHLMTRMISATHLSKYIWEQVILQITLINTGADTTHYIYLYLMNIVNIAFCDKAKRIEKVNQRFII